MDSILFGMVMVACGWLVAWLCTDRSKPSKTWWPFDYRNDIGPIAAETPSNDRRPWDRHKSNQPWKRSGF